MATKNFLIVHTTGDVEADRIFRGLRDDVKARELRKGHKKAAQILVDEEKRNLGRLKHINPTTSRLQNSIGVEAYRKRKSSLGQSTLGAVVVGPRRQKLQGLPTNLPLWIERGTNARVHKSGKAVGSMRRSPYIRPAINAKYQQMNDTIGKELKKSLERTMKRHRRRPISGFRI